MELNVKRIALLLTASFLMGCFVSAETTNMTEDKSLRQCESTFDFANQTEVENWFPILDGVMGGRSTYDV